MAVSLYHQGDNLDRARIAELTGQPPPAGSPKPRPPVAVWLAGWVDHDADPCAEMDSLPGVLHHLSDAWARRGEPNVVLVHYDDLATDLEGEMRRIAAHLRIDVAEDRWPELVAGGDVRVDAGAGRRPRARCDGVLKDRARFFRGGVSGAGRAVLDRDQIARYHAACRAISRRPTCWPGCTGTDGGQTGVCWCTANRQAPLSRTYVLATSASYVVPSRAAVAR